MAIKTSAISSLTRDIRGNVAITFGLIVMPAVMFVGGAIDFGNAYKARLKVQSAADAAVLAAAGLPSNATEAARKALAVNVFQANTTGMSGITASALVTGNTVSLTATSAMPTSFLRIARIDTLSVGGSASGTVSYSSNTTTTTTSSTTAAGVCLLALDPGSTVEGFKSQGTPEVHYENCWAHTNSTKPASNNSGAVTGGGSGAIVIGAGTSAVGGKSPDADAIYTPAPVVGASVVADPFATVSAYTLPYSSYQSTFTAPEMPSSCKASGLNLKKNTFTLEPGRYCGGITVMANATVTFQPGVYYIDGGQLNFQSGAKVTGNDVLFYLNGIQSGFSIVGSGNGGYVRLKGRTSGTDSLKGFVLIAHPNAWRGLTSNIQGGTELSIEGMIYTPTQHIEITGGGQVNANSNFFSIVAKSFQFQGNGRFDLKAWNAASNMPNRMPQKDIQSATQTTTTTQIVDKVQLNAN